MPALIHPQALCKSPHIGEGTCVWAFAHVLPDAIFRERAPASDDAGDRIRDCNAFMALIEAQR